MKVLVLTTSEVDDFAIEALRAASSAKGWNHEALLSPAATRSRVARVKAQPAAGDLADPGSLATLTPGNTR
ncbi:hypothetical protein [Streptomyces canus]|uniref:hypothetical protein n=1 Tax=Streptomyces canus TaxID=58343 RepID=UPI002258F521|nr:hypothetical protein [Streptomyces canus]MCX4852768.1 hypothetical protein [Streptomyces canus]